MSDEVMSFTVSFSYKQDVLCGKYAYLSAWICIVNKYFRWVSIKLDNQCTFHFSLSRFGPAVTQHLEEPHTVTNIPLKLNFEQLLCMRSRRAELKCGLGSLTPTCCLPTLRSYGGPPHFVVLTAGTCIPGIAVSQVSRAAHYLSVCRSPSLALSLSLLRPPLPCCLETKRSENEDKGETGRGGPTRGGWKRREIRGEDRPAGEWWSLFGIVWIFTAIVWCQYPLFTPWLPAQGNKEGFCRCWFTCFQTEKEKHGLDGWWCSVFSKGRSTGIVLIR